MYQYRWNRKYRWKPEVFVNCYFWLHIRRKYAICISFDSNFYFWFDEVKIFEIRPRNFFKSFFFQNAWADLKFRLQIRIQRKILGRIVRCNIESALVLWSFLLKLNLNAHVVIFFVRITGMINITPVWTRTIRREILRWIRICSRNFNSAHAFWKKADLKNLRGRISKIFTALNRK